MEKNRLFKRIRRTFKMNKKKILFSLFILTILTLYLCSTNNQSKFSNLYKPIPKTNQVIASCQSVYESFDPNFFTNFSINKLKPHPSCENDLVFINDDGIFLYNKNYLRKNNIKIDYCEYSVVNWYKDDFNYKLSEFKRINDGGLIDTNEEFFHVTCNSDNRKYKTAFAKIMKNTNNNLPKIKHPINVLFFGLDSVNRDDWLMNLPKTSNYLLNNLKSNILTRYNIVGDGTPAALIPLLTSKHEHELPNTLKSSENPQYVDKVYPFIWKLFKNVLNYTTLFGEDWPHVGSFQYRMVGMSEQPVDHYMRPFHMSLNELQKKNSCLNGRSILKLNLDYIFDFMKIYSKVGFFGLFLLNEYSHDSTENLSWTDEDFLKFLIKFNDNKEINENTILILFSDHGPRFTANRKSVKGLLNERNPFFSIYIPKLFKERYKNEYSKFKSNLNKLITPMDIHRTLLDLINLEKYGNLANVNEKRALSLFSDTISNSRTCSDAGIDQHWCACLVRTELKIDSYLTGIANDFINYLNNFILKDRLDLCHKLKLKKINRVDLLDTDLNNFKPKVSKSLLEKIQNLNLLKEPEIEKNFKKYFFQLTTSPNDAIYEFTIIEEYDMKLFKNNIILNDRTISRINKYGNSSQCIFNKYPDLRKYCFCK